MENNLIITDDNLGLEKMILESILLQGGSPDDLKLFLPLIPEMAGRAALHGINLRSENKVYRLKPVNNLFEVIDHLFIHERLQFQIGHNNNVHRMNDLWPIKPIGNDAYCEVIKITVSDEASMLEQIKAMGMVPAEINYLLDLAQQDVEEMVRNVHGRIITTIDGTNHFDDDKYHALSIEPRSNQNRSSHGNKTQLDFLDEKTLERNYRDDEILVLVRRKDLLPV